MNIYNNLSIRLKMNVSTNMSVTTKITTNSHVQIIKFTRFKKKSLIFLYQLLQDYYPYELIKCKNKKLFQCILKVNAIKSLLEEQTISGQIGHINNVTCLVKINNTTLASGSWDFYIKIWNLCVSNGSK